MESRWITVARDLTPPLVWRGVKLLFGRAGSSKPSASRERDAGWYDKAFTETSDYRCHYTRSPYYFLWCVVVDRVMRAGAASVLDIGCGPGQVASYFRDKGLKHYLGLDLSVVATEMASRLCPEYTFVAANALTTDVLSNAQYDVAISMEFLEHVTEEIGVLEKLTPGVRFIGTVPTFAYSSHVRYFSTREEVASRYSHLFKSFTVDACDAPSGTQRFFLIDGIKA